MGATLGGVAKTATKWGLAIGAAAVTAAAAIGGMAINTAQDVDKAVDSYIVATGTATEETEKFQNVLTNIYKNNYGEDFQDIADSMAHVKQQLGDIDDTELQNVTENALALRDTFDYDVTESVRAAKMMMDQWGLSSEEAFNLIAQGAQSGLDKNGDLLDSINEYSVHFKQIGLSATDMFNTFKNGADNGAFSIDKCGDAIKEMGIRLKDGSATDTLKSMKLDAKELEKAFAEGGERGSWAFGEIVDGLRNIEDPLKRNAAGVAIFGTMWEDLGEDAVFAMTEYGEAFDETLDTMNQIKDVKYDNLSDMFEGLKRNVEMLLLPLGNALMPILTRLIDLILDNMPMIESIFAQMTPIITQLFDEFMPPIMDIVQMILPVLFNLIQQLLPVIMQILQAVLPVLIELINMLLPPIMQIVEMILPILISLLEPILQLLQPLIQLLIPIIDLFMQLLVPLIELIDMVLPPLISLFSNIIQVILPMLQNHLTIVANVLSNVFGGAIKYITGQIALVKDTFMNIIDFVKNVFTGNWEGAWENVKNVFSNIISGLGNMFKLPLNTIIDGINGFIRGVNKIKIPDYVPGVGGKGFNIAEIPRLKVGIDYVPEDDFPAFLHRGEAVLTKEQNEEYKQIQSRQTKNNDGESKVEYYLEKMLEIFLSYFPQFAELMERDLVFEDGTLAARLMPAIDNYLSEEDDKRRRGN